VAGTAGADQVTLLVLICAATLQAAECTRATAEDVIERPATELECAMPAMMFVDVADERNAGMRIKVECER
jgi:hypothetical protein